MIQKAQKILSFKEIDNSDQVQEVGYHLALTHNIQTKLVKVEVINKRLQIWLLIQLDQ